MEILPYFVCIYWQKSMDKVEETLVKKKKNIGLNPGPVTTLNVLISRDITTDPDPFKRS